MFFFDNIMRTVAASGIMASAAMTSINAKDSSKPWVDKSTRATLQYLGYRVESAH